MSAGKGRKALATQLDLYAEALPANAIGEDDPVKVCLRAAAAQLREDACPMGNTSCASPTCLGGDCGGHPEAVPYFQRRLIEAEARIAELEGELT